MTSDNETRCRQTDVFVAGADNIHTYRIPSLLVAPSGALLAFCEARKVSQVDASPTDLVLKRSLDGGHTWGPLQVVVRGLGDEAIMNPCPVVDGDQVLLFCINAHKTEHGRHRHLLVRSNDDGATWAAPEDITEAVGDDTFISGPGVGIRLHGGRLVIPGYSAEFAVDRTRLSHQSRVAFSDDGGRTWHLGEPVADPVSNEAQVVELRDRSLMLNWRINYGDALHPGCRGTALSRDSGETWDKPVLAHALNEVRCQGGWTYRPPRNAHDVGLLLFTNPDCRPRVGNARNRLTVKASRDEGQTWPYARLLHAGPSAYSCPTVLPDDTIAVLYECGDTHPYERLRLAHFLWNWLEEGR